MGRLNAVACCVHNVQADVYVHMQTGGPLYKRGTNIIYQRKVYMCALHRTTGGHILFFSLMNPCSLFKCNAACDKLLCVIEELYTILRLTKIRIFTPCLDCGLRTRRPRFDAPKLHNVRIQMLLQVCDIVRADKVLQQR